MLVMAGMYVARVVPPHNSVTIDHHTAALMTHTHIHTHTYTQHTCADTIYTGTNYLYIPVCLTHARAHARTHIQSRGVHTQCSGTRCVLSSHKPLLTGNDDPLTVSSFRCPNDDEEEEERGGSGSKEKLLHCPLRYSSAHRTSPHKETALKGKLSRYTHHTAVRKVAVGRPKSEPYLEPTPTHIYVTSWE